MKLATFAIAGLLAITAEGVAGTVPGLFNTGVDHTGEPLPLGSPDVHYTITGPLSNAVTVARHISSGSNYTWVVAPPRSAWIGPANSDKYAPVGAYTYTLQFDLAGFDASTVELTGEFASDNKARIFLNGRDTGHSNMGVQYRGMKPFTIRSGFVADLNTLEFRGTNSTARGVNPTGLLVANLKLTDRAVQLTLAAPAVNQTSVPAQPAFAASPAATALPHDNAFGYALPDGIGLTHLVEASPDLVHWSPATNVIFYFKDLESTNFNERFYRFLEK